MHRPSTLPSMETAAKFTSSSSPSVSVDLEGGYKTEKVKPTFNKRIHIISGIVQATLIFSLCASFSGTLFAEEDTMRLISLGMQSYLLSATISGVSQYLYSDMDLSLAAPDIVPTLVFAAVLGNSHAHHSVTTMFAMMALMTMGTGLGCILMGKIGFTSKANNRIPEYLFHGTVILAGLLILSKGVKMSMPHEVYENVSSPGKSSLEFLAFALAGVPGGLALFLQKRYTISKSDFALPVILFFPLVFFALVCFFKWGFLAAQRARETGWVFDSNNGSPAYFYSPILTLYGVDVWGGSGMEVSILLHNLPIMLLASAFLVGDVFFKIMGTIKFLPGSNYSIDREMILSGKQNVVCGLVGGVPSYPQMKLLALNMSVVGKNSTSRVPGLVATTLLGLLCVSGFPLIKFVPRFFLGSILYNIGLGFVVESYVDVNMTRSQRAIVLGMVFVFLTKSWFLKGLLPSVLTN